MNKIKMFEISPKLKKSVDVRLPFDRRHADTKQNYGVHGLDIWFLLKGDKGAVQFACTFNCYLPSVDFSSWSKMSRHEVGRMNGMDVGYHALEPQFEGHEPMGPCQHLDGKTCYYDGSSLRSDDWADEIFSTVGEPPENTLWRKLQEEYIERFGEP